MPKIAVVLMAKYPEPGKVKTRLAVSVGEQVAYEVYLNLLARIVSEVTSLDSRNFNRVAAVTPVSLIDQFGRDYSGFDCVIPQEEGDLGERMRGVIEYFTKDDNCQACILVGADIPQLNRALIEQAAERLRTADLVLGPTDDGGYYMIGMKQVYPDLFEGIVWSSDEVMEQTVAKAMLNRIEISNLKQLRDLDDLDDLEFFRSLKIGTI